MPFEQNNFLLRSVSNDGVPIGTFAWWFGGVSSIPSGWIILDGSLFDINLYPDLYDILGTDKLPDVIDKNIKGVDGVNTASGVVYPELRISNTTETEYNSGSSNYDDVYESSTTLKMSIITAIPIIKATNDPSPSTEPTYSDEQINALLSDVSDAIEPLEDAAANTPLQQHESDPIAHDNLFNDLLDLTEES